MNTKLKPGLRHSTEITVTENMLASSVGSGLVAVFSTVMMVAGMEGAAVELAQPFLDEGQTTVGTGISVTHIAATPPGMKVRFTAELTAVSPNGKGLSFSVAASDEGGLIGEGTHERVVVNREKFESRANAKSLAQS